MDHNKINSFYKENIILPLDNVNKEQNKTKYESNKVEKKRLDGYDSSDIDTFTVNKEYALEYQSRKDREELEKSRENIFGRCGDISESEDEDEHGNLLTPIVDMQILKTLRLLRNKDKSIYDSSIQFFQTVEEKSNNDDEFENKKKGNKILCQKYKDIVCNQGFDEMNNFTCEEQERLDKISLEKSRHNLAYNKEQVALRNSFLEVKNDSKNEENEVDFFFKKEPAKLNCGIKLRKYVCKNKGHDFPTTHVLSNLVEEIKDNNLLIKAGKLVDPGGQIPDGDHFLTDFLNNKRWVNRDQENTEVLNFFDSSKGSALDRDKLEKYSSECAVDHIGLVEGKDEFDSDASMEVLDEMERFESKFNFRFEESFSNKDTSTASNTDSKYEKLTLDKEMCIVGYTRNSLSDSLRRKNDSRKLKREALKERKVRERKAKEEQLRRLKNLRRKAIEERIHMILDVLGCTESEKNRNDEEYTLTSKVDEELMMKLIEEDYDPEKFNEIMSSVYGNEFYGRQDAEWKTNCDLNDETDSISNEKNCGSNSEIVLNKYNVKKILDVDDVIDGKFSSMGKDGHIDEEKESRKMIEMDNNDTNMNTIPFEQKLREKMMDQLYKLDYEDIIGDMTTRFKYHKVEPNAYGLSNEEILFARDTTLKQYVSLNKIAPYNENSENRPSTKKRKRFRQLAKIEINERKDTLENFHENNCKRIEIDTDKNGDNKKKKRKKPRRRQKKSKKNVISKNN